MAGRVPYLGPAVKAQGRVPYLGPAVKAGARTPYLGGSGPAPQQHKGGGGLLGGLKSAAHWAAKKTELAATDLKNIPGGTFDMINTEQHLLRKTIAHPLANPNDPRYGVNSGKWGKHAKQLVKGMEQGAVASVKHPLRDPFQTALLAGAAVSAAGGVGARAAEAGSAARAGESAAAVAKAAVRKPPVRPRFLSKNGEPTPLQPSHNPGFRAVQAVHDRAVQKAIDTKPDSRLARYGTKRIGGSQDETGRYQARLRAVPAQALQNAAKRLNGKLPAHVKTKVEQAALELTSVNTSPEDAAAYHAAQAEKGVNPARNAAMSKLYAKVAERGMLAKNAAGDMVVNVADHPRLAKTDVALARVQGRGDEILTRYGIRSPEDLQAAIDKPGRYRAGAVYEKPTSAKQGVPSQALLKQRSRVARLQAIHDRQLERLPSGSMGSIVREGSSETKSVNRLMTNDERVAAIKQIGADPKSYASYGGAAARGQLSREAQARVRAIQQGRVTVPTGSTREVRTPGGVITPSGGARAERIGAALSVAKDELQQMEKAAAARVKPTGVVGGASARPGRGFVSYRGEEKNGATSAAASSPGSTVGEVKSPIGSHVNTGANIAQGVVPHDITGMAARHYQQIVRFQNTSERRAAAIRSGSAVKQTSRDVLVKIPGATHEKIDPVINEILGKSKVTADDLEGITRALQAYKEDLIPGLRNLFSEDRNTGIGEPAPEGHVWVDRNVLGDLAKPGAGPRGDVAKSFDNVNSSVTSATVYFKIGHAGTRVLTNAVTNIIQGSARPTEIAKSVGLWKQLSDEDRLRALAAAGQHGFEAMPHEGASVAARVAGRGAQFWARRADSPFRFNSIAYEARKAGFDTPAKFKAMLDQAEDPAGQGLSAAQHAKVDWVLKRANREGIAYDRLSMAERRFLTRAFWFYPWLRGTANFAFNTGAEHPFKTVIGGQIGQQERGQQAKDLGDLPSYERGLFKLGGPADHPLVADFSTFSPFATPADLLDTGAGVGKGADFLNPAAAGTGALMYKLSPFGQPSTSPLLDSLQTAVGPAWPVQVYQGYKRGQQDQSRRMFQTTWQSALLRSLLGPGTPRRINTAAAHSTAARERSGR